MREIVIEVRCVACKLLIATPADCDMELFRMGYHVHSTPECLDILERQLVAQKEQIQNHVKRYVKPTPKFTGWKKICQVCWMDANPTEFCPDLTDYANCYVCGEYGLVLSIRNR